MIFLGMQRSPRSDAEEEVPDEDKRDGIKLKTKMQQAGNQNKYVQEKEELLKEIMYVEGYDIKDRMLKERREWVQEQKIIFGKVPADLDKFNEIH